MKRLSMLAIIGGAALLTIAPFSLQWSQKKLVLSLDRADARIGRPLTPFSIAGVNRRAYRRAYRGAFYGAAGYGYGSYYGGYGYPAYSGYSAPQTYYSYAPQTYSTYYAPGSYYGYYRRPYFGWRLF